MRDNIKRVLSATIIIIICCLTDGEKHGYIRFFVSHAVICTGGKFLVFLCGKQKVCGACVCVLFIIFLRARKTFFAIFLIVLLLLFFAHMFLF